MGDNMNINSAAVEAEAAQVSSAAGYFTARTLTTQDTISTITANANSKQAFTQSQGNVSTLGKALDADVENIRNLGDAFEEFDRMMGTLNGQKR